MTDLFGENIIGDGKFRAIGLYQPFCSLMLPPHLKKETRVPAISKKTGRPIKLPFPLGKYLFYSTLKHVRPVDLQMMCGGDIYLDIQHRMQSEDTATKYGYAIGIGNLTKIVDMQPHDEKKCYIKYRADRKCLIFENVQRIEPFEWNFGKQGVGFVPDSELSKIKILTA